MRACLVHLSDIHFRKTTNPVSNRIQALANAILATDPEFKDCIVVVSGDIAREAGEDEYGIAAAFLGHLRTELSANRPGLAAQLVSLPGNHDCILPVSEIALREILVKGLISSIETPTPDKAVLDQLLQAQRTYWQFEKALSLGDGVPQTLRVVYLMVGPHRVRFNVLNTAILSQRTEHQGTLRVPIAEIERLQPVASEDALSISVLHHSYVWIESNNGLRLRSQLERISDIVLTGHQHHQHSFYKTNSTGEAVLYLEGGALQDEQAPSQSAFSVLLFDFDASHERTVSFKWVQDAYKVVDDSDWRPLQINREIRNRFDISSVFLEFLSNPGANYVHRYKSDLRLSDIFVYPALRVMSGGNRPSISEVLGKGVLQFVMDSQRLVVQAPDRGGRTALAKTLFTDLLSKTNRVPLFIDGSKIKSAKESRVHNLFKAAFENEYSAKMFEQFNQLPRERRVLLVDDWHKSDLNGPGQKAFLQTAYNSFGSVILFANVFSEVYEIANPHESTIVQFDRAKISEFGPVLRGELIDRWAILGREHSLSDLELQRETEDMERLLKDVLGRNTLPALPFIILCVLQAHQENKINSPEEGSFGYLYEVLVTGALSKSNSSRPQIDKKYTFLSLLAYRMFKDGHSAKSVPDVRTLAAEYSQSHLVNVDIDAMLKDLEYAQILVNIEGNYSFSYRHLYYYFVARYYREAMQGPTSATFLKEIKDMIDAILSDQNYTVLIFVVYFIRSNKEIIDHLIHNANIILKPVVPATLSGDIGDSVKVEDDEMMLDREYDVRENRRRRRELMQEMHGEGENDEALDHATVDKPINYSEDLPPVVKFEWALRQINLFGHLIRNSPGYLPGEDKVRVLTTTYNLGLRNMRGVLQIVNESREQLKEAILDAIDKGQIEAKNSDPDVLVQDFVALVTRMVALGSIKTISLAVGVPDLEKAYKATLDVIGRTNATRLIDLSIRLDHFNEIPISTIQELHKDFGAKTFADVVLIDMIAYHFSMYDVGRQLMQRVTSVFRGTSFNTTKFLAAKNKK